MPKRGKRRREARRERREHQKAVREGEPAPAGVAAEPPPRPEQAHSPKREAAPQRPRREPARVKKKRRRRGWQVSPWLIGTPVAVAILAAVAFFAISGAGGGGAPTPTPTIDPRIRNVTPTASFSMIAGGGADNAYYTPNTLTVKAGQFFQVSIKNTGDVTHNLTISGNDGKFDTPDDWTSVPYDIKAGQSGTLIGKIDKPGTYPFRCAFHPTVQTGTLTVQ